MFVINYLINEILHMNSNAYFFKAVYGYSKILSLGQLKSPLLPFLIIFTVSRK